MAQQPPQIAILGAGIFVRTTYIPRLAEISNLLVLRAIWSRTEANFHHFSPFVFYCFTRFLHHEEQIWFNWVCVLVQESARGAVEIAKKFFPNVESKWGEAGLSEIIEDASIIGVAVVLAGQTQANLLPLTVCVCVCVVKILLFYLQAEKGGSWMEMQKTHNGVQIRIWLLVLRQNIYMHFAMKIRDNQRARW